MCIHKVESYYYKKLNTLYEPFLIHQKEIYGSRHHQKKTFAGCLLYTFFYKTNFQKALHKI